MLLTLLVGISLCSHAESADTGETIWREMCASCHGERGEGVEGAYSQALAGNRPVAELARVIDTTMPEGDPESLSTEDAAKVAAYIYDVFYSPDAQARNSPPRIELSRLTVRQYRNAIADLVGSFRRPVERSGEHGLRAEYFKGRRRNAENRVVERVDSQVAFDFGVNTPDEKIEGREFAIVWVGSVIAPETGEYTFVLKTEHAVRLWVNDPQTALIDRIVKSGDDTEYRESITLLGGRAYPLRLEFIKANQGVDNSAKEKDLAPDPASIELAWVRPGRPEETVPQRLLLTGNSPKVTVITTPLPPDDRSTGYERGSAVSKAWDEATTHAAIEVAQYVVDDLNRLAGTKSDDPERANKIREFCGQFAERAFRRPLSDEMKAIVVDRQFEQAEDLDTAVKRSVLLTLKSPRFLYHERLTPGDDAYDVAARLSFGLWDSLPDKALLDAAARNELSTRQQIRTHAERMMDDPRAESKLHEFLRIWLGVDRFTEVTKNPELFPGFDKLVVADLDTSLDLFLQDVLTSEGAAFRRLLRDDAFYVNGRLASIYGLDLPADAPFQKVSFEPDRRIGALSHPYLLAGYSYFDTTSPIHRGVFLARSILGRTLMPPPEAIAPVAPDLHPGLTTRERVDVQTGATECRSCHDLVNPLGFSLEHFDAIGRYRQDEHGKTIDSSGSYISHTNEVTTFDGAKELAEALTGSREVHESFVEQLFRHAAKQPIRAYGPNHLFELTDTFQKHEGNIRVLMAEIVTTAALPADDVSSASTEREPVLAVRP